MRPRYTARVPSEPSALTRLRAIGWPGGAREPAAPDGRIARVIVQHRDGYEVAEGPDDSRRVQSPAIWQRPRTNPETRACVGDWVRLDPGGREIVELLPRRSLLKRGGAGEHYRQQLIAANIDAALVVCGLDNDFNPRRIERYLVLIQGGGIAPVVVLTKSDLCPNPDAALEQLSELRASGVPVCRVNAKDPDSLTVLHPWLGPGQTVVLVGSSGAGKSTLSNSLLGTEKMKTSAVRTDDSRGRHTTTRRVLMPLPQGGCLIDTPGMRELKLTGEEKTDVAVFDDIQALAEQCRFRDCQHQLEPGCALRAAVAADTLDEARLSHYLKLAAERDQSGQQLAVRLAGKTDDRLRTRALNRKHKEDYDER